MQNISAMGPLFLVAFVYMACGLLFGVFIREFCYVPRNFWAGILIATAMSSWTSLPTAVTRSSEYHMFRIFILAYNIVMWICGAANTLAWDYAPDVPQGDAANVRASWREKPIAAFFLRVQAKFLSRPNDSHCEKVGNDEEGADLARDKGLSVVLGKQLGEMEIDPEIQLPCRASRLSANSFQPRRSVDLGTRSRASSSRRASNASQPSLKELLNVTVQRPFITDEQELEPTAEEEKLGRFASLFRLSCEEPSNPFSLIPQLKALFVEVDGGPYYHGPDGNPPLTFIINTGKHPLCIADLFLI
ncbi:uncharacterized protein EV420DRAFT_1645734 [Desarmillaria tabescens]|uniref:Uncharacterized protein n=1 Tax=Armillaria tabescens TaxID=1929756 RepID=A0AA39K2D2_ARMTA|nr:uncharacterized protein EV420DRAFT_1645734 [Desarmillaria tabescens]KAK0452081.1 hypothetical protein EV420DRAFT_1645734 [Desarmillaria tabescens]